MMLTNFSKASAIGLASIFWCSIAAAEVPTSTDGTERFSVLVTYGDDDCPEAKADEIVVCAQRPESERYRIPKELREAEKESTGEQSWSSVVASHDEAARSGRPGSCSVNGSFGFTGCQAAIMRQWFDERRSE